MEWLIRLLLEAQSELGLHWLLRPVCPKTMDHTVNFLNIQTPKIFVVITLKFGERGGSVVECRTPEREVRGSRPTAAVLCPWARHFTPRKYWLITQEAMAPSRHDWKIVDWDVKPQHNQPTNSKIWTVWLYHRVRSPNDTDGIANSVDPDQTAPVGAV